MYARFIQNARCVCRLVLGCARVLQVTGMINAGAADPVSAGFGRGFLLHPKLCSEVEFTKRKKERRQWPSSGGGSLRKSENVGASRGRAFVVLK